LWADLKDEKKFDWKTHQAKNNPYEAKEYGATLDKIQKTTSRECYANNE